ncbi:MAG: hypothetical protein SFT68_03090, partial [Rickettsiaceae bacterium]|nr:hypothetical protein [Rickettsiaceae bacterium]
TISIDGENFYISDIQGVLNRYSEIKKLAKQNFNSKEDVLRMIPIDGIASKIFNEKLYTFNFDGKINIINSFKLQDKAHRLEIFIELDSTLYLDKDRIMALEKVLYRVLNILIYKYVHSFQTLVAENLKSAECLVHVSNFQEGVFANAQNKIKLNYKLNV